MPSEWRHDRITRGDNGCYVGNLFRALGYAANPDGQNRLQAGEPRRDGRRIFCTVGFERPPDRADGRPSMRNLHSIEDPRDANARLVSEAFLMVQPEFTTVAMYIADQNWPSATQLTGAAERAFPPQAAVIGDALGALLGAACRDTWAPLRCQRYCGRGSRTTRPPTTVNRCHHTAAGRSGVHAARQH